MVSPEDVIKIYKCLSTNDIPIWLTGGWGIDALLGEQTRPHKDLDVFILLDDVTRLCDLLVHDGYGVKELWSENRWVVDTNGIKTATAFVLQDPEMRELDMHAMRFDKENNGLPVWEESEGFILTVQDLAGIGLVAGYSVQCISAEKQMLCHTGYDLPEKQWPDLEMLHEKFCIEYPKELLRRGDHQEYQE